MHSRSLLAAAALGCILQVPPLCSQTGRFTAVSAGPTVTCTLDEAGRAWCWGSNESGQLGTRTQETCTRGGSEAACSRRPVPVAGDLRFASIAAGDWHTCAIDADGRAWCWGNNDALQLGVDSVLDACRHNNRCSFAPVAVRTGLRFTRLALGSFHTCGLTTDSLVACWGLQYSGQLGSDSLVASCANRDDKGRTIGMVPCRHDALPVEHAARWVEVGAWANSTCGLDAAGGLFCWGTPIGDPSMDRVFRRPTAVTAPPGVHGLAVSNVTSLVLSASGLPLEWGWMRGPEKNWFRTTMSAEFPCDSVQALREGPRFLVAAAGVEHRCGLAEGGTAWCWGKGGEGRLGTGKTGDITFRPGDKWRPGLVLGGHRFRAISAGVFHTCGLALDGGLFCWGENVSGQLGIGSRDKSRKEPVPVLIPTERTAAR